MNYFVFYHIFENNLYRGDGNCDIVRERPISSMEHITAIEADILEDVKKTHPPATKIIIMSFQPFERT